ncbi:aldehyde ferredoxin oxidoreductase family protein [Desulfurispora thermophila]|uniref:aldehyde ferredoxin oxidoreductase family protein n=1 Tax=Desulfurispora thermophila TaxID=265470 RepID=UPI0003665A57|nr:aldehyde ferredoxin oxidoreductase family protein [Desulfurispora thermophila]
MGYTGNVLRVDLTTGRAQVEELRRDWARKYLGGKGLGIRYLYEELTPGTDPLAPENKVILATGPFTGTIVPCSGKLGVITRSPANGAILDCSIGGNMAAAIKFAGYDLVIVEGRAAVPVFIKISDQEVSIESAEFLWGQGTHETEMQLRERLGSDFKIMSIGPAGENLVPFACITAELYRQAGRGGIGAVWGSKNLKALAVQGTGSVRVADMPKLLEVARRAMREDLLTDTNLWAYTDGTPMLVEMSNNTGILPTRNFQSGCFEGFAELKSDALKHYRKGKRACFACGLGCGNYTVTSGGRVEGPEYETLALAGSNCGIASLDAVVKFNSLCDDLGLDTISTGNVIAFAMELAQRGIKDFGLRFGDVENYLHMPELIARKQGIGAELARGVKALAEQYGGLEFAMQVKGLEFPGYEPRGSWAMGLAYATAPRGACHMSAWPVAEEAYGERDPFSIEGKAQLVIDLQHYNAAKFSLILCDFWALSFDRMAELLEPVTGEKLDAAQLERAGERIFNLARLFNLREGISGAQDTLPGRIFKQPLQGGATDGKLLPEDQFKAMLGEYYQLRGWSKEGVPLSEKLTELEL